MNTDHYHTPDELPVFIAPRAARAPRKLERAALIEAKKALCAKKRTFSSSNKEPLMTRFLRAASADEIDAFLRMPNPEKRSEYMNRLADVGDLRDLWKQICASNLVEETLYERNAMNKFLHLPAITEETMMFPESAPISADQLLWSARAAVMRRVRKNYPAKLTPPQSARMCAEAQREFDRLNI